MGFNLGVALGSATNSFKSTWEQMREEDRRKKIEDEDRAIADAAKASQAAFENNWKNGGPGSYFVDQNGNRTAAPPPAAALPTQTPAAPAAPVADDAGQPIPEVIVSSKRRPSDIQRQAALPAATAPAATAPVATAPAAPAAPPPTPTAQVPAPAALPTQTPATPAAPAPSNTPLETKVANAAAGANFRTGGMSDNYYNQALAMYKAAAMGGPRAAELLSQAQQYAAAADQERVKEFGRGAVGAWSRGGGEGLLDYLHSFSGDVKGKIETVTDENSPYNGWVKATWGNGSPQYFQNGGALINTMVTQMMGDPEKIAKVLNENGQAEDATKKWFYWKQNAEADAEINRIYRGAQADLAAATAANKRNEAERASMTLGLTKELDTYRADPFLYQNNWEQVMDRLEALNPGMTVGKVVTDPSTGAQTVVYVNPLREALKQGAAQQRQMLMDPRIAKTTGTEEPVIGPDGLLRDANQSMVGIRTRTDTTTGKVERFYVVDGDDPKNYYTTSIAAYNVALKLAKSKYPQRFGEKPKPTAPTTAIPPVQGVAPDLAYGK